MRVKLKVGLMILGLFAIGSCTIQKREHLKGWHVEWKKRHEKVTPKQQEGDAISHNKTVKKEQFTDSHLPAKETDKNTEESKESGVVTAFSKFSTSTQIHPQSDSERMVKDRQNKLIPKEDEQIKNELSSPSKKQGDSFLYALAVFLGLGTIGGLHLSRRKVKRINKWAKSNRKKAQGLIAGIQVVIAGMSMYSGYNLAQMGYQISDVPMLAAGTVLGAAFACLPFKLVREKFILPKRLKRRRLAFVAATVASSILLTGYGNQVHKDYPDSIISRSLGEVDQAIFSNTAVNNQALKLSKNTSRHPVKKHSKFKVIPEKKSPKDNSKRVVLNILFVLATLSALLTLLVTLCAGYCIATMASSPLAILGGVLLAALSAFGIIMIFRAWFLKLRGKKD